MDDQWEQVERKYQKWGLRFARHPILWIAGTAVLIAGLSFGALAIKAVISPAAGALKEQQQIQGDPANRIFQQERFEQTYQDIKVLEEQEVIAVQALQQARQDGTSYDVTRAETNLTGVRERCVQVVGDYNAAARKVSAAPFRSHDVPYQVNPGACSQ